MNKIIEPGGLAMLSPKRIVDKMNKHVVGQDKAKKVLAVALYNHIKRVLGQLHQDAPIHKSNVLMLGPTGSGKTYLIESIAKELQIPLGICDATTFTESGYWGEDVEQCLYPLLVNSNMSPILAQRGIVYIDEIDKIAERSDMISKKVTGVGVQRSLLKIMEGKDVVVSSNNSRGAGSRGAAEQFTVNTSNILFICGGAFSGLDEIIKERIGNKTIGFTEERIDDDETLEYIDSEDIIEYGFIPELLGRLPVMATLDKLTEDDLVRIISEPDNNILDQYKALFMMDAVEFSAEPDALKLIAKHALEHKTGARGLRTIFEKVLLDLMYETPDRITFKVVLTEEIVKAALEA